MNDKDKQKYGGILILVGALVMGVSLTFDWIDGMWVGLVILVPGGLLLYAAWQKWYCAQCGQFLGRGSRPGNCGRCGSNRVTNKDPGVGDAVRVMNDRRGGRRRR